MAFLEIARGLYTKPETVAGTNSDPLDKANTYTTPTLTKVRVRELDVTIDPQLDDENSKYLTGDFTGDESIVGKVPGTLSYSMKFAPGQFILDAEDETANEHSLNYEDFLASSGLNQILITDPLVTPATYTHSQKYLYYPSTAAASNTLTQVVVDKNSDGIGIAQEIVGSINNLTITADGAGAPFTLAFEAAGGVDDVYEISAVDMAKLKFDGANVMETVASK
jgi:hypothetical protein